MKFLIDHLPVTDQNRIRAKNAREMQQLINKNPILSGTQMDGIKYRSQNNVENIPKKETEEA